MYTVKKYENRKLYLPSLKKGDIKKKGGYISSKELLLLRTESGVQVFDNKTGKDITQETVLSAINELAKEDSNVRDALIASFDEKATFMLTPKVMPEVKLEPVTVIPPLDVSSRVIQEEHELPENTIVAQEQSSGDEVFKGF